MITVSRRPRPGDVRHRAGHVLFVEGSGRNALDPKVLKELRDLDIRVEPLGASFHVSSVAEALHEYHPTYYFLVDRDHHDDAFVEASWTNFPDPEKKNLLVWPRRELEN